MNKYYIGKAKINGEVKETGHLLSNFRGTVEEAADIIAATNPGLEELELTENGDSERGFIVAPKPADATRDFAEAMMRPPRTVKVGAPRAATADPQGRPFNPAVGVPTEAVPAAAIAKAK